MKRHLLAASAIAGVVGACVIAEPPADLPTLPATAPRIVRGSVVPAADSIITVWPDKFIVPVQLADARSDLQYSWFVDYNPATGDGLLQSLTSKFDLTTSQSETRLLEPLIDEPSDDTCHVIEVVVALSFSGSSNIGQHTPAPPGGDTVHWLYSPGGNAAGCPVLDAGLQPDASALISVDSGSSH